jgi:hypothetical protein
LTDTYGYSFGLELTDWLVKIHVYLNCNIFSFQFYFPCESWRDYAEAPSEEVSERFRRKALQEPAEENNAEEK